MVQIAINKALKTEAPKFNKKKFGETIEFVLTQTCNHQGFLPVIRKAFLEAGVVLVVLPNLKNSGINGATKKIDGKIMLMVNDRRHFADTFWFTLFHEIGHIMNGDYGITFKDRDPGIVFGRLQNDGKIPFTETSLSNNLRHRYKVSIV